MTPAAVPDTHALQDLRDRGRLRYLRHPRRAVADATDGTGENQRALAARGIRASRPLAAADRSRPFFRQRSGGDRKRGLPQRSEHHGHAIVLQ